MKSHGNLSFPLYLPPTSNPLGVSPDPPQLSESCPSALFTTSLEIFLNAPKGSYLVMSVLQNFFDIAGKNYFVLETAIDGFDSEKLWVRSVPSYNLDPKTWKHPYGYMPVHIQVWTMTDRVLLWVHFSPQGSGTHRTIWKPSKTNYTLGIVRKHINKWTTEHLCSNNIHFVKIF